MILPELVAYIYSERKKGVLDHIIKANFLAQGWSEEDFAEAVASLPPAHPKDGDKPSDKIIGHDFRTLGSTTAWRTPDGKIEEPAKPIFKRYPRLKGWLIWGGVIAIIVFLLLFYWNFIQSILAVYYEKSSSHIEVLSLMWDRVVQGFRSSMESLW